MKAGQSDTGRAHLSVIEADAKAKGYNLIARKAPSLEAEMAHFECSSRSKDARLSGRFILRTRHFRVNVGKGNNFPLQPAESFPCGFDCRRSFLLIFFALPSACSAHG